MSGLSSSHPSTIFPALLTLFDFLSKILDKIELRFSRASEREAWERPFPLWKNFWALGHPPHILWVVRQQAVVVTTYMGGIFERKTLRGSLHCCAEGVFKDEGGGNCMLCRTEPGPGAEEGMLLLMQQETVVGCGVENRQQGMEGGAWEVAAVCTLCCDQRVDSISVDERPHVWGGPIKMQNILWMEMFMKKLKRKQTCWQQ